MFHATSDLALADIFADYWRDIGVDIEIVKGPDNTTVGTWIREHTYPHDMIGSAIMGYDRSPITILRAFIHSEGGYNYTGVRNPEFDAMIEAAEAAATYEERQSIIKELDLELSRQQLYVWGMKAQAFNAVQPWLIGYNGEYHLGLKERVVITRHATKNALIPVVTGIGLQLPLLVGGVGHHREHLQPSRTGSAGPPGAPG